MNTQLISFIGLSMLPFTLASASAKQKKQTLPNIVIIYADDIGYGDLSCYGYSTIKTPNIDKLASEGLMFTNAHSVASTSTPSRYSLLTGEYAWRKSGTGIAAGDAASIIKPDRNTMPKMLQSVGYTTAAVGKWHLGLGEETGKQNWNSLIIPGPHELGFDYSYIMAATGDRTPCVFIENGRVTNLDPNDPVFVSYTKNFPGEPTGLANPELLKVKWSHRHNESIVNGVSRIGFMKGGKSALWVDENIADSITLKAVNFIEQNHNKPFFLYFGSQDAHVPRIPHPRFAGKSGMGSRGDALLEFDWSVGRIIETLKRLKLDKNTLIMLSSDNGPVLDDGYMDQAVELLGNHKPWGPFRGGKYSGFEAGTRVPQIVCFSGKITPGISDALVSQIDWYASLAVLTGYQIKPGEAPDSFNDLKNLYGKKKTDRKYVVKQNLNLVLSIVVDDWKYIEPGNGPLMNKETNIELGNLQKPQLYHLKNDLGEKENLAESYPEKVMALKLLLEKIRATKNY